MQKILYRFVFLGLGLISRLPFGALYLISDFLRLLLYRVFGYRRAVVMDNLTKSFPEKSLKELRLIERRFYRNLCDIVVETIKSASISKDEFMKRNVTTSHKVVDDLNAKGKTVFYFAGHCGNWELSPNAAALASKVPLAGAYKKLSNPFFDEYMRKLRSRFGCNMIEMAQTPRFVITQKAPFNFCFIADQTPVTVEANAWIPFLNRETLFFIASSKLAKKINASIVYGTMHRKKRGFYEYEFELLVEDASEYSENEILSKYVKRLEHDIQASPDNWLWSHRRWKRSKF